MSQGNFDAHVYRKGEGWSWYGSADSRSYATHEDYANYILNNCFDRNEVTKILVWTKGGNDVREFIVETQPRVKEVEV